MPTTDWLKKEFHYGYDSGNILSLFPNKQTRDEQKRCGGSYRKVFNTAAKPYLHKDTTVLELGPGKGSWSRAILKHIPDGRLLTIDYQDTAKWLNTKDYQGRLTCYQVTDNSFVPIDNGMIDFFWSFGVLCHNNIESIGEILANTLIKLKPGAYAAHQYGEWDKLEKFGWDKGGVPENFKEMPDDEIWWPRNSTDKMVDIARRSGWEVVNPDLHVLERDGLILLRRPS